MITIHKYPVDFLQKTIRLPEGAMITGFGIQGRQFVFWCQVDTENKLENRVFYVVATGQVLETIDKVLFSFQDDLYVWHLVEIVG